MSAKYTKISNREHVLQASDVWGAVNKVSVIPTTIIDGGSCTEESLEYSPLLCKILDEIIVNAIDQSILNRATTNVISVSYVDDTITVYNNGASIPIEQHAEFNNVFTPELIFFEFLSGSNFNLAEGTRITGGKNGIGAKLTNTFSTKFICETSNKSKKLYYSQTSRDNLAIVEKPIITPWKNVDKSLHHDFVRITFTPDYKKIGYNDKFSDINRAVFEKLIRTRMVYASIYAGPKVNITYQGVPFMYSVKSVLEMFGGTQFFFKVPYTVESASYTWEVGISVDGQRDYSTSMHCISIVNGVYNKSGGTHVNYLLNELSAKVKEQIKKTTGKQWNMRRYSKYIALIISAVIPDPSYNSQAKDELTAPTKFDIKLPVKQTNEINKLICGFISGETVDDQADKTQTKKKRVNIEKYDSAQYAGTKRARDCALFIPEGDSAYTFIKRGLTSPATRMGGLTYYGIFSIQGKPMNARRHINYKKNAQNETKLIRSEKLKNNKRLTALVEVLGLDYTVDYTQDADFAKLNYGRVIVAVDQDVDGVGHIFGLILNFFHLFWPALIDRHYIRRLATPIIRAFSSRETLSFYSDLDYRNWCQNKFKSTIATGYKIKYYKGLAGHNVASIESIFKNFNKTLYTYARDVETDNLFEVYFGEDPDLRKVELRTIPVQYESSVERPILCSQQLRGETKEYQLADIARSLPHLMDGLRPTARIVIAGMRNIINPIKVFQVTGTVTSLMHYQHGDTSLSDTLIRLAQTYSGARNLPYVYGEGEYGSRAENGKDAGAPRYIDARLNARLTHQMFPLIDNYMLEYRFDDNCRCEPLYYVPVLPTIVLENFSIPATGWKANIYARNINDVVLNVCNMITTGCRARDNLPYWNSKNRSSVVEDGLKITMIGVYEIKSATQIRIVELPYGVWTQAWREKIEELPSVVNIVDNSCDDVDVTITLKPDALKEITGEDKLPSNDNIKIQKYFNLIKTDTACLNVLNKDGCVYEADNYAQLIDEWFVERKRLYGLRVQRRAIQLKWLIIINENKNRYATEGAKKYNLSILSKEEIERALANDKYIALNASHICQDNYVSHDKLEEYFLTSANYDYLLSMNDLSKLNKEITKRAERIAEYKAELNRNVSTYFAGSDLWLNEIKQVYETIILGHTQGWNYGANEVVYDK